MKRIWFCVLLLASPVHAADYAWPVVRVVDGDTVAVDASADNATRVVQAQGEAAGR